MPAKTDTEVIIGGQVLTLSGHESEEYLQRVASYINNKLSEYNKLDSFKRQSSDRRNVLIQLNIADYYFKAKDQIEVLKQDLKAKVEIQITKEATKESKTTIKNLFQRKDN